MHVDTVGTSIDLGESRADRALAMWDLQAGASALSAERRAKPDWLVERTGFEPSRPFDSAVVDRGPNSSGNELATLLVADA